MAFPRRGPSLRLLDGRNQQCLLLPHRKALLGGRPHSRGLVAPPKLLRAHRTDLTIRRSWVLPASAASPAEPSSSGSSEGPALCSRRFFVCASPAQSCEIPPEESSPGTPGGGHSDSARASEGLSEALAQSKPPKDPHGGPPKRPPPPPRVQALHRIQALVETQLRGQRLPPAEEEAEYLLGSDEGIGAVVLEGEGPLGAPTGGLLPLTPLRKGEAEWPPKGASKGASRRSSAACRELLQRWRQAADDICRFSGRMHPKELLEVLRLLAVARRRDPQLLLAVTQALQQQAPDQPLSRLQVEPEWHAKNQQQRGVEALSVMQTVMLLRHLQILDFTCVPLVLRALSHLDRSLTLAAQTRMQLCKLQQTQGTPLQHDAELQGGHCFAEDDFEVLAPGAAVDAAGGKSAAEFVPAGGAAEDALSDQAAICAETPEADAWKTRYALHAVGVSLLSSSLVSLSAAANQLAPRSCKASARLIALLEALAIHRASAFNAPQTVSLGLNCVALGRTSLPLLRCLIKRTEELLPFFSFPLLTLQLNSLTRLLQINSRVLLQQQVQQRHRERQHRTLQREPQQVQEAESQINMHNLSQLWARLRDLLHDHILAAQEAYDASLKQYMRPQDGAAEKPEKQRSFPLSEVTAPSPQGDAEERHPRDTYPNLPPVKPHELKNVVNALNSFARLAHLGFVSLRDVSSEASAAAAVAAAAAAAAADQMVPTIDAAACTYGSSEQQHAQRQQHGAEAATAEAAAAASGEKDELQRWQTSRARLSSVVECTGSFRMRGVEMGPADRRSSSSIYGLFHRAILLLVQEQHHLDPQSLSNAVNAFAKARLQGWPCRGINSRSSKQSDRDIFAVGGSICLRHARYVAQLIPRMIEVAPGFNWQHVSMTLNGLAYLRWKDDGLLQAFWRVLRERSLHLMGAQATTNIIHAMGSFGYRNSEMMRKIAASNWVPAQLPELTTQGKYKSVAVASTPAPTCIAMVCSGGGEGGKGAASNGKRSVVCLCLTPLSGLTNILFSLVVLDCVTSKGRNVYNRLYDSNGNFLLHALQQQQRHLERQGGHRGRTSIAKHVMQLNGAAVPAAIVRQPPDVFKPYEQLDEGHKFLAALLTTRTLMFYPGKPSGMHLQVAATLRSMGLHAQHEVILDPYVIDILIQSGSSYKRRRKQHAS
ncbi:hypothetical protein cyc_00699 [Cyclospora cayetanensis]|uniref:RAP domain-containing protein n=1 Tax=Cyclospora cayetanensis TaxID=88456 RepID=A0A1D3CRA8_9EIME|nr:hypothetical protein cyc_00699 [Cyclospora cayetanensis]